MKKITLYSLGIFMMTTTLLSCKKFLDKYPITEVGPDVVFKNSESVFHAIAGVYAQLTGDQGYGKVLSLYFPLDTDETFGPSGGDDNGRRDIARYIVTPANIEIQRPFEQLFRGIEYANICIVNIPKMDAYISGSDIEKGKLRRMLGEALTLRAQFYHEAIKNWGDLPAHFLPASTLAILDPTPRRISQDSLYDQIIADLKEAEDLMPWANQLSTIGDQPDERITKGTAKALRARIALFRGGYALRQNGTIERRPDYQQYYQIARDECAEIMAAGVHQLNPSYKDLWKNQVCGRAVVDPHNELMFQVGAIGLAARADSKMGYYNGPTVSGFGNRGVLVLPTHYYAYNPLDQRRDVNVAPYNVQPDGVTKVAQGPTALNDGKWRRDWITNPAPSPSDAAQYFSLKWQLIRYADVLLMFAEAENELNGPTPAAYEALNKVRRRGFGLSIDAPSAIDATPGLSKTDFFNTVVNERSFEFCGEGLRKYDLLRWNLLKSKIDETRAKLQLMELREGPYEGFPTSMYYRTGTTADDGSIWTTSLYEPAPPTAEAPPASTRISWIGSSITTTILARYAIGFNTGKAELLPIPQVTRGSNPNLSQNPNY
ncbi:MAG TPA: RagB/SusD family nutrient uptake outer membrane protein [Ferruginibacter sp.]|nr:RagB/SusD family nutrient uptake outer membrane protein [Ferruginibacter sp.]HMP20556.1 RagB/SusD family nutrient uptake outer membrane protein [Ferruginibacter sp.]